MGLLDIFHSLADRLLGLVSLAQNREYGWTSLDRKSGQYMREQQPLLKKLRLLLLFNPLVEWIDTTQMMRLYIYRKSQRQGIVEGTAASRNQIKGFVEAYNINMDDFTPSDISQYTSFEDFFVRHHAPGSRPIHDPDNHASAVVVADSRVVVYNTVSQARKLWVKGANFSLSSLAMDNDIGAQFADGAVASFRLSPQDYHRYHSPVTGKIKAYRSMPGDYYQVDPIALQSDVDILTRNRRDYVVIETEEFGEVLFVAIGAEDVGSVNIHKQCRESGHEIKKGDEIGTFQFGGSSIVVAFEKNRIKFDDDLVSLSQQRIQTSVEVGMSLGVATTTK